MDPHPEQTSETKWFVYCGTTYYPWHEIVEASTAEEALAKAINEEFMSAPTAVFPLSALAAVERPSDDPTWPEERSS